MQNHQQTIRQRKNELIEKGCIPLNEVPGDVEDRKVELKSICEDGEIKGAVFYSKWFVPESYLDKQMK